MADEKLNTGPGEEKLPETPAPVTADEPQAPAPKLAALLELEVDIKHQGGRLKNVRCV